MIEYECAIELVGIDSKKVCAEEICKAVVFQTTEEIVYCIRGACRKQKVIGDSQSNFMSPINLHNAGDYFPLSTPG